MSGYYSPHTDQTLTLEKTGQVSIVFKQTKL
jgi:hypothetical protein